MHQVEIFLFRKVGEDAIVLDDAVCQPTVIGFAPLIEMGFPGGSCGKESACNAGYLGSIPRLGRSPGGGHGNPFQ